MQQKARDTYNRAEDVVQNVMNRTEGFYNDTVGSVYNRTAAAYNETVNRIKNATGASNESQQRIPESGSQ